MRPAGCRFCPAVLSANGRGVNADVVLVRRCREEHHHSAGCFGEEHHPAGCYYIEWRAAGKRKRQSVGKDQVRAHAARMQKEAELNARARGVAVATPESKATSPAIAEAIVAYLTEIKISNTPATYNGITDMSVQL